MTRTQRGSSHRAIGLPLVALLQGLGLALSLTPHGGALVRHSRTRAAPLQSYQGQIMTPRGLMETGDGADILPAAVMDHPVLGRVARAANAAVTNPNLRGTEVGSSWVPEYLREEFRASVRGLRFDHAPGDGLFEALYAAAGRDAEEPLGLQDGARLARICGGRHWDLLVYLFPASGSTARPGPASITQQPEGTIQLLKPLIGVWEHAIDKREGKMRGRVQVRQVRAGERSNKGGAVKLHGGPVREFSGADGGACALFEAMLKRPVTNDPPPPIPLLELTPELAAAFYDDGGKFPRCAAFYDDGGVARGRAEPQRDQYAGNAQSPIGAPGGLWEPQYDEETGDYFYVNSATGETSWEPPAAAGAPRDQYASSAPAPIGGPDGLWEPQYDDETGDYFYVNSVSGETSWEPPATAAPQRDQYASSAPAPIGAADGSTWEPQCDAETGDYFYVNSATGEASWDP